MENSKLTSDRYPIGTFQSPSLIDQAQRSQWIGVLRELPPQLRKVVESFTEEQLNTPYREAGWTVRQVVHHVPDSHLNSYTRFRLALTEDNPTIRPYDEARWAELSDARTGPIEPSLQLLEGLHDRWAALLESLTEADFARTFYHPELKSVRLDKALGLYAWHSRHHLAQITGLRDRMGW